MIYANKNGEDDIIDLGGNTFNLNVHDNDADLNGFNGLPAIVPDNGHKLKIKNGTIIRVANSEPFRFFYIQASAHLILEEVTMQNGIFSCVGGDSSGLF